MNRYIYHFAKMFLAITFILGILTGCYSTVPPEPSGIPPESSESSYDALSESLSPFYEALSSDNLSGMTLRVYNRGFVHIDGAFSKEDLIEFCHDGHGKTSVIDNITLVENFNLLRLLDPMDLILTEDEDTRMSAYFCIIFEDPNGNALLEIAGFGIADNSDPVLNHEAEYSPSSVFINGFEVRLNSALSSIINKFVE